MREIICIAQWDGKAARRCGQIDASSTTGGCLDRAICFCFLVSEDNSTDVEYLSKYKSVFFVFDVSWLLDVGRAIVFLTQYDPPLDDWHFLVAHGCSWVDSCHGRI